MKCSIVLELLIHLFAQRAVWCSYSFHQLMRNTYTYDMGNKSLFNRCRSFCSASFVVGIFLVLTACGSGGVQHSSGSSTHKTKSSPIANHTAAIPIHVVGNILVGENGRSLYLLTADTATTPACSGPCLSKWPPVLVNSAPASIPGLQGSFTVISRPNGTHQLVFAGHPLYYFSDDVSAGMKNGEGLPFPATGPVRGHWWLVSPDGAPVTLPASTTAQTSSTPTP